MIYFSFFFLFKLMFENINLLEGRYTLYLFLFCFKHNVFVIIVYSNMSRQPNTPIETHLKNDRI